MGIAQPGGEKGCHAVDEPRGRNRRNRIEALLERAVEGPFQRRTSADLPLLKSRLRRAMEEELRPVPPSRYRIALPAAEVERLRDEIPGWEAELRDYFLQLVRENGWGVASPPEVRIVTDARPGRGQPPVAVENDLLIPGTAMSPLARRRGGPFAAASSLVGSVCLYLLVLLASPQAIPTALQPGALAQGAGAVLQAGWGLAQRGAGTLWQGAQDAAGLTIGRALLPAARASESPSPREYTGVVSASPALAVRAGEPSTRGGVRPGGRMPRGSEVRWRENQVVRGEAIEGEDRWIEIGMAGAEWGPRTGQPLYVWMGGVAER